MFSTIKEEAIYCSARFAAPMLCNFGLKSSIDLIGCACFGGISLGLENLIDSLSLKIVRKISPAQYYVYPLGFITFTFLNTFTSQIVYNFLYKNELEVADAFKLNSAVVFSCAFALLSEGAQTYIDNI